MSDRDPLRVLYITTYDPAEMTRGGAAWVDQRIIDDLRDVAEVEVFVVCENDHPRVPLEIRGDPAGIAATLSRMLITGEPFQTAKFKWSRNWKRRRKQLTDKLADGRIVVTSQWPALVMANEVGHPPAVHIAHNADYVLAEQHDPVALRLLRNSSRTRKSEIEQLSRAGRVLTLSMTDRERWRSANIGTDQVDLKLLPVNARERDGTISIGFLGKASWPPNQVALSTLVTEILPEVEKRIGVSPRLIIAGKGTSGLPYHQHEIMGELRELSEFYRKVDLVVLPRLGVSTGVSVKMLEAVENGVAVIAPTNVIRDAALGHGCIAADTPAEMVDCISSLVDPATQESPTLVGATSSGDGVTASLALTEAVA